jgi:hypothetical protein
MIFTCEVLFVCCCKIWGIRQNQGALYGFLRFFFTKYEDDKWVENFRMSKSTLFNKINRFQVVLMEQGTHYRKAISIEIQMAHVVYKLAYNMNFLAHSLN